MRAMLLPVLAVLSFTMLQIPAPAVPAIVKDPAYPLRVQLVETGATSDGHHQSDYGHGNLLGPPTEGFDYQQECNLRFSPRADADQVFHARWKKQGQRLEVLIQELGSDHIIQCELKIAMREQPVDIRVPRSAARASAEQTVETGLPHLALRAAARPAVPVTEPDANFPLRLQLWITSAGMSSMAGSHAEGYGNVIGPPAQGFDFANECPIRLATGRNTKDVYQARWLDEGLQLEILVQEVGTRQESVCTMDVGMKAQPYAVPTPGVRVVPSTTPPRPQAPTNNSNLPPP